MLGLDAAGKTTILYKLHIGEILSTVPTIGKDNIEHLHLSFLCFCSQLISGVIRASFFFPLLSPHEQDFSVKL
jgi:hypothetical protein